MTPDAVIVNIAPPDIHRELASGPLIGGVLSPVSWRLIFFVNVPAGAVALAVLARAGRSPRHSAPFDWAGQAVAVAGMGGLTYGAIEAGATGITAPSVLAAFALAVAALTVFGLLQARGRHPMLPLSLFRSRTFSVAVGTAASKSLSCTTSELGWRLAG